VERRKTRRRWSGVLIPGAARGAAPDESCGRPMAQVWNVPLGLARRPDRRRWRIQRL
jgi:hypothetical protein